MKEAGHGAPAIAEGVKIAKEMLSALEDRVVGCYIMPQLGKFSTAMEILAPLGYGVSEHSSSSSSSS